MRTSGFSGFSNQSMIPRYPEDCSTRTARELKVKGMKTMRGPMNFSTNEECGFLVEGFDFPSMLMTPYNPPYYGDLMETYGMEKIKDLYAYIYDVQETPPEKVMRVAAIAERTRYTREAHR